MKKHLDYLGVVSDGFCFGYLAQNQKVCRVLSTAKLIRKVNYSERRKN